MEMAAKLGELVMPVAAVAADTMHEDDERAGAATVDRDTRRTGDIVSFPFRHGLAPFWRFGRYAPDCAAKSPGAASANQGASTLGLARSRQYPHMQHLVCKRRVRHRLNSRCYPA